MKSTILAMVSGLVFVGCGSGAKTTAESTPPSRQGTIVTNFEAKYLDAEPALSADGSRAVFTTGRESDRPQRIYRIDRSSPTPAALTGESDLGMEYAPALSPDGEWVSFAAIKDGVTKLYVTSFDGASRMEVALEDFAGLAVSGLRFSEGASPLLAVSYETSMRARALAVVKLTASGGALTAAEAVAMKDVAPSEAMPRWAKSRPFELVTMDRRVGDSRFVSRTFADETVASVTRTEEGMGLLTEMVEATFSANGDERFYIAKLVHGSRKVKPEGNLVKEDGSSGVGEVIVKNELRGFHDGASPSSFESRQFNVLATDATPDGGAVLTLGTEYFACQHKQFYGTTLLIHNPMTKKHVRLLPVWNAESKTWTVTEEPCSLITEENRSAKLVDTTLQRIEVQGSATQVKLVYQSFFFGDPEIFEMEFDWDGSALSNPVVTNLSNNYGE